MEILSGWVIMSAFDVQDISVAAAEETAVPRVPGDATAHALELYTGAIALARVVHGAAAWCRCYLCLQTDRRDPFYSSTRRHRMVCACVL